MSDEALYVSGIALSQFVHGARTLGLDSDGALRRAGLQAEEHLRPNARIAEALYERVVLELILASEGDSFGIDIGQQLMPPLYGVLMTLAFSTPTLGAAMAELSSHAALASGNCGGFVYRDEGDKAYVDVVMTHQNPVVRLHIAECVVIQLCGLIRLISGRANLAPEIVTLEHNAVSPRVKRRLENVVSCPVQWQAERTCLQMSKELADLPILGHGDETLQAARQLAASQLKALQHSRSALDQVRWHAREIMRSGIPNRDAVAQRMNLSVRSLDRRLKEEDTNWQEVLDGLRAQRAQQLLTDAGLTIADVAEKLGYADTRAFQRRFKVWTGFTPSEWRQRATSG